MVSRVPAVLDSLFPSPLIKSPLLVFISSLHYKPGVKHIALRYSDVTSWILKLNFFAAQIRLIQSLLLPSRPRLPLVLRTEPFAAMVSDSSLSEGVLRRFLPNAPATLLLA